MVNLRQFASLMGKALGLLDIVGSLIISRSSAKLASVYQLESGVWSRLSDMARARDLHACVAMEGNLYIFGGYGTQFSVEIMKISTQEWKAGPLLNKGFSGGQAFVHNSSIYLVYKEGNVTKLTTDGWENVASVGWIGWRTVYPLIKLNS